MQGWMASQPLDIPNRRKMPQFNLSEEEVNNLADFLIWASKVDTNDRIHFLKKRDSVLFQNDPLYYADYLITKKQEIQNDKSIMNRLKEQAEDNDMELNVLIEKKANWLIFKDESKIE